MLKRYILIIIVCLIGISAKGYTLVGSWGYYTDSFSFSCTENTANCTDSYGLYGAKDMWIKLSISKPMKVTIDHAGSTLTDTRLYLLNSSHTLIYKYNPPYDGYEARANIEQELMPGVYFIVSEGNYVDGNITVNVQGTLDPLLKSINAGTYSANFAYFDIQNTNWAGTEYGWNDYDITYKFIINKPMNVTISNCGSAVNDTYLYLYNSSKIVIARNDNYTGGCPNSRHAYIQMNLDAGTYYVISEGLNEKGNITTRIEGTYPEPDYFHEIGTKNSSFSFSDNDYVWVDDESFVGPSYGDSFYQLILGARMSIEVSNCGSEVWNTNIYILNATQDIVASSTENSTNNTCANSNHAYLKTPLEPGIYYIVTESPGEEGDININVTGTLLTGDNEGGDPNAPNPSSELSDWNNYILTITPTVKTTTINGLNVHNSIQKVQYYDGLGRPLQQIQRWGSPNKHDLISHQEYDPLGRKSNTWLPVVANYNNGTVLSAYSIKEKANASYVNENKPYSKAVYENSPLNRISAQYGPGQEWHDQEIAVRTEYLSNNSGLSCRLYKTADDRRDASVIKSGEYDPHQLYITKLTNEENQITYEYKNKLGQTILTRQMEGSSALDTYYIYDSYGNLKAVLPPLATDHLSTDTSWPETDTYLQQYAYLYKYDIDNRCIAKKMPGADWIYYVYDKANRLIFTQDGELRDDDECKWIFSIPDKEGRVVLTGTMYNYDFYVDDETWSGTINSTLNLENIVESVANGDIAFYAEYTGNDDNCYGYTLIAYDSTITQVSPTGNAFIIIYPYIQKVSYYDNYQFLNQHDFPNYRYDNSNENDGYGIAYDKGAQTFLTGTMICDEYEVDKIYTIHYYDDRGRLIQSHSTNQFDGKDSEYIAYNFIGLPTKKMLLHTANGKANQAEYYTYKYDHTGRLLETKHKKNTDLEYVLSQNTYDELGRISSTTRNNQANLTENNTYNIRSWLISKTGPQFNQHLSYTPGGNIVSMQWGYNSDIRSYTYEYDDLSRLKTASYTGIGNEIYNTAYTYDKHGNITTLQRYGRTAAGSAATSFGIVDNLGMTYYGNQLADITESGPNVSLTQSNDFKKYSWESPAYEYNKNGAMIKDLNKGISNITYNSLNLPVELYISNTSGDARNFYTYLSDGRKLRVVHESGVNYSTTHTTDYVGNKIYENGSLKRILIDGGYIENGVYHFYFTDHLGNNRAVVNANGSVIQRNHYYPFGMAFAETTSTEQEKQPYQYGGKELDRRNGLNLYDYSARYMEPALGRFTSMDPLAEKYYPISPYAYCLNNPMKFVDPTGMELSPYYNSNGVFLGVDEKGFKGDIYITSEEAFNKNSKNGIADSKSIQNDEDTQSIDRVILTEEAESEIYTDAMLRTEGVDFSKLYNGKVSIKTKTIQKGQGRVVLGYNDPDDYQRYGFSRTNDGMFKVTVKSGAYFNDFKTVEAIQNYLGVHEYNGHGNKGFSGGHNPGGNHWKAYELQTKHSTFKLLPSVLQNEVKERMRTYMYNENRNLYYRYYGK